MPQQIGQEYRTLAPTFADAASIEEALKLYHYGVANYTSQPIPDDSIEGNFRKLQIDIDAIQTTLDNLQSTTGYVKSTSETSSPNVITTQAAGTVPLTIRGVNLQSADLQVWQNSTPARVAAVSNSGGMLLANYLAINSTSFVTDIALSVNISSNTHKGIVVRAAASQPDEGNLQEWRDFGNTVLAKVSGTGSITAPNLTGSTSITSPKVTVSGTQTLEEFRVRNTYAATTNPAPADGQIGDIWFTYTP